jgi:hypothetical protein
MKLLTLMLDAIEFTAFRAVGASECVAGLESRLSAKDSADAIRGPKL